uniref:Metalloendopeptidase n=1 Tax=Strongyloides stercoralis TaxID=6248 RepID=A0A0K0EJK4_STRER
MYSKYILILLISNLFINIFSYINSYDKFNKIKDNDRNNRIKRQMYYDILKFWASPINYYIDPGLNEKTILLALYEIEENTCILFKRISHLVSGMSGIRFVSGPAYSSIIGKNKPYTWQNISIGIDDSNEKGLIQHELLHTLGLFSEQNRYDRDNYVFVSSNSVELPQKRALGMYSRTHLLTYGLPYDYGSMMHDGAYSYGPNSKQTIFTKDVLYKYTIGAKDIISFLDYELINLHYCGRRCKKKINCLNEGYQNPLDCSSCKCVKGFTGKRCENFLTNLKNCGESVYQAKELPKKIKIDGFKSCTYHILAKKGRRIVIYLKSTTLYPNAKNFCYISNSIEIKFYKSKSTSGARFCLNTKSVTIVSSSSHVIVSYRSSNYKNNVEMLYREVSKAFGKSQSIRNKFSRTSFFGSNKYKAL